MRNSISWKSDLLDRLRGHAANPDVLCDVELALTLASEVCTKEPASVVPALLSANPVPGLNPPSLSERHCGLIARARTLLRCRGEMRWQSMLRSYNSESELVRMYDPGGDGPAIRREPSICPDRYDIYILALSSPPPYSDRTLVAAEPGEYWFPVRGDDGRGPLQWHSVSFTEEDIAGVPVVESQTLSSPRSREPLRIPWSDLRQTAEWMDQRDDENWLRRLDSMRVDMELDGNKSPQDLILDGLFHLVGMVSSGKSTLMDITAVWAGRSGLRIMLVVGDNVDVTTRVERFRNFGLNSVPIMGLGGRKRRMEQMERVAISEANGRPAWKDPRLKWVSPICPIIGFGTSDIADMQPGSEPCESLREKADLKAVRRSCPLMSACPVHLARNRVMDASIWVGTPQSLILTRAPMQSVEENVRFLETVYRECDLVIVDEADRVQTHIDEMFAPSVSLVNTSGNGLMEILDRNASAPEGGSLNKTMSSTEVLDWSTAQRMSQQAANVMLNLCANNPDLRKWITLREYFTAYGLASMLHGELASEDTSRQMPEEMLGFLSQPSRDSPLQRLAVELTGFRDQTNMATRGQEAVEWLRELYPSQAANGQDIELLQLKLSAIALTAFLDSRLKNVFESWEVGEGAFDLGTDADLPFQRPPREYEALIPSSPMGNLFGFRYRWEYDSADGDAQIEMFRCVGVGRWVLTNLHDLYRDLDEASGPHVMLLSGSSWAPGSSSYHVLAPVDGVLLPPEEVVTAISTSTASFDYALDPTSRVPIRVSGLSGESRDRNLASLLAYLAGPGSDGRSQIDRELELLSTTDAGGDSILMVTGSYQEARRAYDFLSGRVNCGVRYLVRDDDEGIDRWNSHDTLRRGQVAQFAGTPDRILIAPLMAIERGHNIVSEDGRAVIGSVYFLMRPMPVPYQFSSAVREINHWAVHRWAKFDVDADSVLAEWNSYRRQANAVWGDILRDLGQFRNAPAPVRRNLVWTQLVAFWQTVGRAVRGGSSVRVHFCDAAFAPESATGRKDTEKTSMLVAMREELDEYLNSSPGGGALDERERKVCQALYAPWRETLSKHKKFGPIAQIRGSIPCHLISRR